MVGGMSNEISAKINEEVTPSLLDRAETQEDIVEEDIENLLESSWTMSEDKTITGRYIQILMEELLC